MILQMINFRTILFYLLCKRFFFLPFRQFKQVFLYAL